MNNVEVIEIADGEKLNYTQGKPPFLIRARRWLIKKIAGQMPVLLNLEVSPHHHTECAQELQINNCRYGLFSNMSIRCVRGYGITFEAFPDEQSAEQKP